MKVALPLAQGNLSMHFGHCDAFAVMTVDADGQVTARSDLVPPPHEPGVLPVWLHNLGVTHVIAGGMGSRAQGLFAERGISVIVGAPISTPEELARQCALGKLASGDNVCDH